MRITKAEDGTFVITEIKPNDLESLMYMVKASDCEKCENLYRCRTSSPCAAWIRDTRETVHQHWIDTAGTEAERNYLREEKQNKIEPWIASGEVPFDYFGKHYQCPDCKRCVVVDPDNIDEYNFCPVCGARRIEDDREN